MGVLGGFKRSRTKAHVLFLEKLVLAELNWQLPEFSKLSFICKQSKKHAGSRDTVTSRAHDFPGSARSYRALCDPPLYGGRVSNKGDGVGGTVPAVSKWDCGVPTQPAHTLLPLPPAIQSAATNSHSNG